MEKRSKTYLSDFYRENEKKIVIWSSVVLVLAAIVFFVYMPILDTQARTFDDDQYLFSNTLVKNPSFASAEKFLTEVLKPSTIAGYYQPFAMISLMIDYAIAGSDKNMMVFHRTSLILHILNTIIIFIILAMIFKRPLIAAFTSIFFGVHPMAVETIAWIGERKTTLAAFFGLLCILCYTIHILKNKRWLFYIACLMYIFSLMSKPTGTTIPMMLILMDFWPFKSMNNYRDLFESIKSKTMLLVIAVISAIITYISQSSTSGVKVYGIAGTIYKFCFEVVFYLKKIFYPTNMSVFYPPPEPFGIRNPVIIAGIIGTILLLAFIAFSARKTRAVVGGFLIFFILLFPAMGLIGFSNVIASDKYAYLPAIGLLMLITWGWGLLIDLSKKVSPMDISIAVVICVMLITGGLLSRVTRNYISLWQTTEKLYTYMLSQHPNGPTLYYDLALDYMRRSKNEEAKVNFLNSIKYYDDNYRAFTNLGIVYYNLGEVDNALESFNNALKRNREDYLAYENIALALMSRKDYQGAVDTIKKCNEYIPGYYKGYKILGDSCLELKQYENAIEAYKKAIELVPGFEDAYLKLAKAYAKSGKKDEAKKTFITININNPQNVEAITGMERIHFAEKRNLDVRTLFPD